MNYIIRRMREEDIPQVVEIEKTAFSRPWSKSIFKATLLLPYAAYYVAVEDKEEENRESSGGTLMAGGSADSGKPDDALKAGAPADSGKPDDALEAGAPADSGKPDEILKAGASADSGKPDENIEPGKIVGMCGVKKIFEEGEISNVAVHPDFRGKGISRKMLNILMREAREDGVQAFTLEVRAGNGIAINLYESLGFRTEGVRRGYYDHPKEDGLIMWQRP